MPKIYVTLFGNLHEGRKKLSNFDNGNNASLAFPLGSLRFSAAIYRALIRRPTEQAAPELVESGIKCPLSQFPQEQ